MLTDLNTSVTDISPEALDALLSGSSSTTTNEETPATGTTVKAEEVVKVSESAIPEIDLEELEKQASTEEDKEGEEGNKETDNISTEEDKEGENKEKTEEGQSNPVDASLLKNSVNYLVEKGIFKDFEGREDLEMTEEVFADLLEAQVKEMAEERYGAKKSSAGDYGQAILDYIENGGDPDQIIDLFKERKEVAQFDISTEDSQKEIISRYYKEVHGWRPERIKRELDALALEEDALETEAKEIKAKYDQQFQQEAEKLAQEQETQRKAYDAEVKRQQQVFETSIKDAIKAYEVDDKRKQLIEQSILKKSKKLSDGTRVSELDIKFAEWQRDPKKFIELAEFILDQETYLKRKEQQIQNKVVNKTYNFVKGNQATSKTKGTEHAKPEERAKNAGTNFSVIFKK